MLYPLLVFLLFFSSSCAKENSSLVTVKSHLQGLIKENICPHLVPEDTSCTKMCHLLYCASQLSCLTLLMGSLSFLPPLFSCPWHGTGRNRSERCMIFYLQPRGRTANQESRFSVTHKTDWNRTMVNVLK